MALQAAAVLCCLMLKKYTILRYNTLDMKIVIDGRFIKQTGIGRYIEEMVEQVLLIDKKTNMY